MELRWLANVSLNCCHAAAALLRGETLADARLHESQAAAADALRVWLESAAVPWEPFLEHLVPLAAGIEDNRQLAEVVLRKAAPNRAAERDALARVLTQIERSVQAALPELLEESAAAGEMLQDRWYREARHIPAIAMQATEPMLFAPRADVLPCLPLVGSGGAAHVLFNSVRIEAPPSDPRPEVPETLRLAWLLSQLNLELPRYQETLLGCSAPAAGPCALLPLVLSAAETSRLIDCSRAVIPAAVELWLPEVPDVDELSDTLWRWWQTYTTSDSPWPVAVAALERLLPQRAVCV